MTLPDDIAELEKSLEPGARAVFAILRKTNEELTKSNRKLTEEIAKLNAQVAKFQKMLFGRKSEKLPPIESEVRRLVEEEELFGQNDDDKSKTADKAKEEEKKKRRRKRARADSEAKRKKRRRLRDNLPVIKERVVVTADNLPEGYSLDDFREVGANGECKNIIRRVEHVREHLVVVEYELQTLASRDNEHIITAPAPPSVIEGGHYGSSVYAHDIVSRCEFSLPHNRLGKMLSHTGALVSRSTLTSLFHRGAELLKPIYDRLFELTRQDPYVNADETGLAIWQKGGCAKGWVWMMLSVNAIVYYFSKSRGGKIAKKLLGDTNGYLQIDGYSGYNQVCDKEAAGRTRVGCWSHARRLFFEALSELSENRTVLEWIVELYRIEYKAAELDILGTQDHLSLRQKCAVPIMDKIYDWIMEKKGLMPPQGATGKAITYAENQWESLCVYLTDPLIRLDNNLSENALRIVALGRKNFLFVGHEEAGQNMAILQTITSTCRLHNVDAYEYIKDILIRIQTHPASKIDELLPQNWSPTPRDSD
ncbi:MAG: IS66 family transposase [Proteobacteria bacterium]|nr:IS66 family transposase [Pseudomonadota bacterium]